MKRVASLYLPDWPIDRLRRAARTAAPPEAAPPSRVVDMATAPRGGGWRPGARWALHSSPERGGGPFAIFWRMVEGLGARGRLSALQAPPPPAEEAGGPPPPAGEE